ncbi:MAG: HlyD family efflux transporter periplasmic adaptor subunit [Nitrospirales bacterium]|nr:HlyD family efflux transporter periplasmic adaptor subunit [Nitrospirales bacterium]
MVMTRRAWLFLAILMITGAVVFSLWGLDSAAPPLPQSHRVLVLERKTLETKVTETGTLEPVRTIDIKSQFSGEVRQLFVSAGKQIAKDQILAVIRQEPSQARQAVQLRAKLEQEGIDMERARRNLVRMQALHAKGFIAQVDLESAEQDAKQTMVRRELAERELQLALGGNQDLYQRYVLQSSLSAGLEEFEVRSPSPGTVIEMKVQPGEIITSGTATVGGGTVLMQLADLTTMVAKAQINEVNIARVQVEQPVTVTLDAIPGAVFQGTVRTIAPQGKKEESIVTYEVLIRIDNNDLRLRPMMTANIDIITEHLSHVLTVPLEALQTEAGDDLVFLDEGGQKVKKKVKIALRTESEAVVVQGLAEGDRVILPTYEEPNAHQ